MVFGGGKKQREAEATAERARKEVLFWKDQLDHAVNEKTLLLEKYTEVYRKCFQLEHVVVSINTENTELRHLLDRTVGLNDERRAPGGPATPTSGSGASTPDGRHLQHNLHTTRAALKQADVRIAILEERNITVQQENDLLQKQNELLRSSEAAYQKEAQLLREELTNARGINDLTADETTKLLLENSRLQQALVAARSEVLHKDEMLRLLSAEINELNGKLETYAHACQSIGIDINWDNLSAEPSSERLETAAAAAAGPFATSSASITAHPLSAPETASAIAEEVQTDGTAAAGGVKKVGGSSGSSSSSGGSAEPGSAEAAVEALAAAMPLRLSGLSGMIRTSTQDRKGTFSGQPITPRDMAEAKQKLAEQESKQHHHQQQQQQQQGSSGHLSGRPPRQAPHSTRAAAAVKSAAAAVLAPVAPVPSRQVNDTAATAANATDGQQQQQKEKEGEEKVSCGSGLQVVADEQSVDDPEGMLQGSPNLADDYQHALVREATPPLTITPLSAEATPSADTPGDTTPLSACQGHVAASEAAAVAAVTAAIRSSLGGLPTSDTQHGGQDDASSTIASSSVASSPKKVGSVATAVTVTAAARAMLAAGVAAGMSPDTVNEFKLAARVVPPAEPAADEDDQTAEPIELTELQPGIPQRQQALARLAAGQNHPKPSASRRLAVAHAEGPAHNPAEPSPRTNLAEALMNPAALVAAAAAAGVLDAPDGEPAAAAAAAEGAAAVVVCQRQAALARLAADRESRLLQQQQGGSRTRSRSSSPADASSSAAIQRKTAVTRLGLAEDGNSSRNSIDAPDSAAAVETTVLPDPAEESASSTVGVDGGSAAAAAAGGGGGDSCNDSVAVQSVPDDAEGDRDGDSAREAPAPPASAAAAPSAGAAVNASSNVAEDSSNNSKDKAGDNSTGGSEKQQQQSASVAAVPAAVDAEQEPAAATAAPPPPPAAAAQPAAAAVLDTAAAEQEPAAPAPPAEAQPAAAVLDTTAAEQKPAAVPAASADVQSSIAAASMKPVDAPTAASNPAEAAPTAAAAAAPVTVMKQTDLPRSNSLKDRIAAMNALNQSGIPTAVDTPFGTRAASSGGQTGNSNSGAGVIGRYLQAEQHKQQQWRSRSEGGCSSSAGASGSSGGPTVPSRIPHGPAQKPNKILPVVSKIPSKVPAAPDAATGFARSRSASPNETPQQQQNGVASGRRVSGPDVPFWDAKDTTTHSSNGPAVGACKAAAADAAAAIRPQDKAAVAGVAGNLSSGSDVKSSNGSDNGSAATAAEPARSSLGGVGDVLVEVTTNPAAPKAAAVKAGSSDGGGVGENDVITKDASTVPAAADSVKAVPLKRQLSNRMAARMAAFEKK